MPSQSPFGGITTEKIVGGVVFIRYRWEDPSFKELWDFRLEEVTADDVEVIKRMVDADSSIQRKIAAITEYMHYEKP